MATLAETAIQNNAPSKEVAKAAVKDAVAGATTDAEKQALALEFYKEATGRFPQDSSDRRAVYIGGFVLVAVIFVVTAALVMWAATVPEWLSTLATALGSGIIGGLFGYARQA